MRPSPAQAARYSKRSAAMSSPAAGRGAQPVARRQPSGAGPAGGWGGGGTPRPLPHCSPRNPDPQPSTRKDPDPLGTLPPTRHPGVLSPLPKDQGTLPPPPPRDPDVLPHPLKMGPRVLFPLLPLHQGTQMTYPPHKWAQASCSPPSSPPSDPGDLHPPRHGPRRPVPPPPSPPRDPDDQPPPANGPRHPAPPPQPPKGPR